MFKNNLNYKVVILFSLVFVTFLGCKPTEKSPEEIKQELSTLLQSKFSGQNFEFQTVDSVVFDRTINFYNSTNFKPIWVNDTSLNRQGSELFLLLSNSERYGLWPSFYNVDVINDLKDVSVLDAEVLLTNALILFTTHLQAGVLEKDTAIHFNNFKQNIDFNHNDLLRQIADGKSVSEVVLSVQPKLWEYQQLQKGLAKFVSQYKLDTVTVEVPRIKDDSAKCYDAARKALVAIDFISEETAKDDSLFLEGLKAFQLANGLKDDAVVGRWTGRMLEKSNNDRFLAAAVSLEKWRWKAKDTIPDRYIWVNLPSYTLKLFDKNELVRQHRVVVGAYGTQTPEFHSKLKRMVTNPFWYVPYSIASTEILNGIKKDTTYLQRRGYKIFRDGAEVNSKTVDWTEVGETNFRYNVRQNGGGGNSLGKIKFLFPNKHAVYIHDTPSKSLFMNDIRAYSHGCVRLHEPYELAKAILKLDNHKVESDSLVPMINRGAKRILELNTEIDVYIEYYTTTGDSLGKITFYPDMYNRDEKYISIFKENLK
ncbi:MAG: murein L,D-transpeptidase [Crocinitomicaceae bacterium]